MKKWQERKKGEVAIQNLEHIGLGEVLCSDVKNLVVCSSTTKL